MNVGDWMTWNINDVVNWNFLENGFYDEFRKAQQNLKANVAAGKGTTFAYTGIPGTSALPIFMAYFAGYPLTDTRNQNPANYTNANFKSQAWYDQLRMYQPNLATNRTSGIASYGTNGLQNSAYDKNRAAAGLPVNFFTANPAVAQGYSYLDTNGGNTAYHALQFELRRRMTDGLLVQASYNLALSRMGYSWTSLRENWQYVNSTGGPAHAFKLNWVFQLPFGRDRRYGSGASKWMDLLIGGWEWDGQMRLQSGGRFNYGNFRLVGMSEQEFRDMFKFYHVEDSAGKERIYMLPQDVIENSILAIYTASASTESGYSGASPTGKYLAPASGPDCVQYLGGMCPGTSLDRIISGPWYQNWDFAFVKRIAVVKSVRIEARMDLFNVFDAVNFIARAPSDLTSTTGMGASKSNWEVTQAASDLSASQYPGGRMTSFGLRVSW